MQRQAETLKVVVVGGRSYPFLSHNKQRDECGSPPPPNRPHKHKQEFGAIIEMFLEPLGTHFMKSRVKRQFMKSICMGPSMLGEPTSACCPGFDLQFPVTSSADGASRACGLWRSEDKGAGPEKHKPAGSWG